MSSTLNNLENTPPAVANINDVTAQEYSLQKKYCLYLTTLKFQIGDNHVQDEVLANAEANLHSVIIQLLKS